MKYLVANHEVSTPGTTEKVSASSDGELDPERKKQTQW